jgi:glycine cleavage system transcriptional repressor
MSRLFALSAIGRDRPGIVAAIAKVLFEKQCNLEESSMTRLGDDFAVLLLVSTPHELSLQDLRAAAPDLTFELHEVSSRAHPAEGVPYTLVVYGVDKPGIVFKVTEKLAEAGINIVDLRTHMTRGLYSLVMDLEMPSHAVAASISEKLAAVAGEMKVDITLNVSETDEL